MSSFIKSSRLGMICGLLLAWGSHASAASIGVNFSHVQYGTDLPENAGNIGFLQPAMSAGALSYTQTNWNNLEFSQYYNSTGNFGGLKDNAGGGVTTLVNITADQDGTGDIWNDYPNSGDESLPNNRLMKWMLQYANGDPRNAIHTIDVTNIPYASYNLVLYHGAAPPDGPSKPVNYDIDATTGDANINVDLVGYVANGNIGVANYSVITGLSGATLKITQTWPFDDTESNLITFLEHGGLAAFQIIEATAAETVPEPSTYALGLIGLAGLGLFAWRRRK